MRFRFFAILLFFTFLFLGCRSHPTYLLAKTEEIDRTRSYVNPLTPLELKVILIGEHKEAEKKEEPKKEEEKKEPEKEEKHGEGGKEGEGKPPPAEEPSDGYHKLSANVYLIEKTPGVLHNRNLKVIFGPGGGTLDLAEFVDYKKRGTFYFAITPDDTIEGDLSVYWVSQSPVRKVGDDLLGSGCNKYFEITKMFKSDMLDDGFAVNTSELRYVSALSGEFYLKIKTEKATHISTIKIFDSRFPNMVCK